MSTLNNSTPSTLLSTHHRKDSPQRLMTTMKTAWSRPRGLTAVCLAALAGAATAHTWPESTVRLAPNGTMIGNPGFDRNHIPDGDASSFKVPPPGLNKVEPDHKLVRAGPLNAASYPPEFPMLSVAPGDWVAIRYRENGHVSRADSEPMAKPVNRGTVYLYGTTHNDLSNVSFMDVHLKWTADGKGGDGKGRLLATRHYDDGQCHEAIPATGDIAGIVASRRVFTNVEAVLCQSDVQIPADAPVGSVYSIIWVWDWATLDRWGVAVPPATYEMHQGDPAVLEQQFYTGVVDYKIVDPCDEVLGPVKGPTCKRGPNRGGRSKSQFVLDQPAVSRGIPAQMAEPFLVKVPQAGFNVNGAAADPKYIPFAPVIGKSEKPQLPWPANILAAQNTPRVVPGAGGGSPSAEDGNDKSPTAPGPSLTPTPTPTLTPTPTPTGDVIVTATVVVPEVVVTETVTRGAPQQAAPSQNATTPVRGRRVTVHW
ncbi:hypothetical protein VTJ83DRAFT_448 [Remersonia thermophila]|uniref:DUF7492 domain-containing protein n=1 Tax=Remersonia thermophila TaxID=72144 RepID=A0ABR4DL84_9PEZI